MLIADVNVYVGAHRQDDPAHPELSAWLTEALGGAEAIGVSELVLSAFVRIVTNSRVFRQPATPEQALEFCAAVRSAPAATVVSPGQRHWDIFCDLVKELRVRANDVPDAYLAALAIEQGATFVTRDRGFRRFPGLRLLDPLAP